jgi:putative flippase GtrA
MIDKIKGIISKLLTRETITYLIFGGLTTVINYIVVYLMYDVASLNEHIANLTAWVVAVLFAYVTNRIFVFGSKERTVRGVVTEMGLFFGARVFSLLFEELIIFLFVTLMGSNMLIVKAFTAVAVIIFNYIASKLLIFKNRDKTGRSPKE